MPWKEMILNLIHCYSIMARTARYWFCSFTVYFVWRGLLPCWFTHQYMLNLWKLPSWKLPHFASARYAQACTLTYPPDNNVQVGCSLTFHQITEYVSLKTSSPFKQQQQARADCASCTYNVVHLAIRFTLVLMYIMNNLEQIVSSWQTCHSAGIRLKARYYHPIRISEN